MEEIRRIKRELAYKGRIINIYKDYMALPNGHTAVWDFVEHKGAAAVVAVTKEGKLLKDIIAERGIQGFLEVEDQVNAGLHVERTVISPGGSVVYCENAMKHFKKIGKVLYLKASFETISRRLKNVRGRGVVLGDGQTLKELYDERVELFEKYADITVCEDGLHLDEMIEKVMKTLRES